MMSLCLNLETGQFTHFPMPGSALEQPPEIMACIRHAWRVWWINEYKPAKNIPHTQSDTEFMQAILPPDYVPPSSFDKSQVKALGNG